MRIIVISFLIFSLWGIDAGSATAGNVQASDGGEHYVVGAGDVLEVSVWKDEALSRVVTVLPDGMITLPLVGDYMAMGKSIHRIREEIKKEMSLFVPNPELIVSIKQVNSMWVYVIGKVMNAGRFNLNSNVNVLQALSMAGGVTPFANSSKIRIFREKKGRTEIFLFNYNDVTQGKNLYANIRLEKGDVIVVP